MAVRVPTRPVEDKISKIGNELAVGEDLEFQHRWWSFEQAVWWFFTALLLLDIAGVFGRGPLAHAHAQTADGTMKIDYERVERYQTPSILTIHFGANAIRDGKIQLWVSENLIKPLGSQRIIPQPESSVLAGDGILYSWASTSKANSASFALEPASAGSQTFTLRMPATGDEIRRRVIIMP
jgi:hypothetical protein